MKERDLSLDAVCGFFIIIMMLWHTRLITEEMYHAEHFFYFFMPWFYFKSGMFAKYGEVVNKENVTKLARRLLVPCVIFAIYGLLMQMVTDHIYGNNTILGTIYTHFQQVILYGTAVSNKPVWFLISLFAVKILFNVSSKHNIILPISIGTLVIALIHQHFIYNHYCFLGNIPLGYLYYVTGHYLKEKQYNNWVLAISIILLVLEYVFIPTNVDMRGNCIYFGSYPIGIICSIFGVIIMNNLFRVKWLQLKTLVYIGKNSISFLVIHYPIIWLMQAICIKYISSNHTICILFSTIVIFICSFAFAHFISKSKYKWIIGD